MSLALLAYCAVSPRNLPVVEYNRLFKENFQIASLVLIAPAVNILMVFDAGQNDINTAISTFYTAFTVGYGVAFLLQIIVTTFLRLGVFAFLEPEIFGLTPKVPSLVLPWVLREYTYKPSRLTLFAADFLTSCVASPIIEEYVKLRVLKLSVNLPR